MIDTILDIEGDILPVGPQGIPGKDGITPTIGENGNWFIGEEDTGLPSRGPQGEPGKDGQDGKNGENGISLEEVKAITGELENLGTEDKSNLVNAINEVMNSGGSSEPYIFEVSYQGAMNENYSDEVRMTASSELINKIYNSGRKNALVLLKGDFYTSKSNVLLISTSDLSSKKTQYTFIGYAYDNSSRVEFSLCEVIITGSWSENVFTASHLHIGFDGSKGLKGSNYLSKTNTASYTPTNDYNPATKKYVDDSVASVGSACPVYDFPFVNWTAFNISKTLKTVTSTDTATITRASEIINDMKSNGFGAAIINFYNKDQINTMAYMCISQFGAVSRNSTDFTFMAFNKRQHTYTQNYEFENVRVDITGTWTDDVFTCTKVQVQGIYINFENGIASKKDVDDAITAAITTVLEGEY